MATKKSVLRYDIIMDNVRKQKWVKYYAPAYIYAGLIFTLSSYSLMLPSSAPHNIDKLIHFSEYVILGFLLARAYFNARTKFFGSHFIIMTLITGILCSVLDECYQTTVPLRTFEYFDLLADTAGIFAGIILFTFLIHQRLK